MNGRASGLAVTRPVGHLDGPCSEGDEVQAPAPDATDDCRQGCDGRGAVAASVVQGSRSTRGGRPRARSERSIGLRFPTSSRWHRRTRGRLVGGGPLPPAFSTTACPLWAEVRGDELVRQRAAHDHLLAGSPTDGELGVARCSARHWNDAPDERLSPIVTVDEADAITDPQQRGRRGRMAVDEELAWHCTASQHLSVHVEQVAGVRVQAEPGCGFGDRRSRVDVNDLPGERHRQGSGSASPAELTDD